MLGCLLFVFVLKFVLMIVFWVCIFKLLVMGNEIVIVLEIKDGYDLFVYGFY